MDHKPQVKATQSYLIFQNKYNCGFGCILGADFTNIFRLLSSFSVDLDFLKFEEFLEKIANQCASMEELKVAFKPQMDPRYKLNKQSSFF